MSKENTVQIIVRLKRDFVLTYIAMFLEDIEAEKIITPSQRNQARDYILKCQGIYPYAYVSERKKEDS